MMRSIHILLASALIVAGCATKEERQAAGKRLETVEVAGGPQRYIVDFYDQGNGQRLILVSSAGYRGLDRGEGELAFRVATQAGERSDCGDGKGVRVAPETANYVEQDRGFNALSRGGAVWQFKGYCGG
ncbi:hypothetical protein KHP62_05905 [Rhodobacteraceae bacterium NNCM2]|nr:hypothetical protein [Coraliihabitans acroporae]